MIRCAVLMALLTGLGACAGPLPAACAPGTGSAMAVFTLYMGESIRGGPNLTAEEWQSFLETTVTTALPDGYTTLEANGAWLDPETRRTSKEPTKVLIAAMPDTPESLAAINRVRFAYQQAFRQQSVGMTVQPACGMF